MNENFVSFELLRIILSDCDGDHKVVLKEISGSRQLAISIGTFEALAIHSKIHEIAVSRPMTHDLMADVVLASDLDFKELLIDTFAFNQDGDTGTFHGKLLFHTSYGIKTIDCRPSDGIALAVRLGTPISVHESVLDSQAV